MWALRLETWGEPPQLKQIPVPTPAAGQVLLRVTAAGLCHSDLHLMDGVTGQFPFSIPFTLGHEIVGEVVQVGSEAHQSWIGQSVAVHGLNTCGSCSACSSGRENYCGALTGDIGPGIGKDGGLAEYVLIESTRQLVPFDGIAPEDVAPLTDAGVTSFHAIRGHLDMLTPEATVLVIGIGGLGHLAIQTLSALTEAHIVTIDTRESARQNALELGAHASFASFEDLQQSTEIQQYDVIFDFVGAQATAETALRALKAGGGLVLVGSAGAQLQVGKQVGFSRGWSVTAPFWGTRRDLVDVVSLAARKQVAAHNEVWQLSQVNEAYAALRRGEIQGRAVVTPTSM